MKTVTETIHANGIEIGIYTTDFENEFLSLTDIAKYRNEDDPRFVIQNWMRNRNTIAVFWVWFFVFLFFGLFLFLSRECTGFASLFSIASVMPNSLQTHGL